MAHYHEIDSDLWEEMIDYDIRQTHLYIYLFSNPLCRPSGLYTIHPKTIKHHTTLTDMDIKSICGSLIEYDFETHEVFVRGKLKRVLKGLSKNFRMVKSIQSDFDNIVSVFIKQAFINKYEAPLKGLVRVLLPLPLSLPLPLPKDLEEREKPLNATREEVLESDPMFNQLEAFNNIFQQYPRKGQLNRSASLALFCELIVNDRLLGRIGMALEKYCIHLKANSWKNPLSFKKWLEEWPDWENHEEPVELEEWQKKAIAERGGDERKV